MRTLKERFEEKIFYSPCGCWLWTGSTSTNGYGNLRGTDRNVSAHKTSYQIYKGSVPNGLLVLHRCDVRNCVNPDHLFLGTSSDNMIDMFSKNRGKVHRGEKHFRSKLKSGSIQIIKDTYKAGFTQKDIANYFHVDQRVICKVVRNESYQTA